MEGNLLNKPHPFIFDWKSVLIPGVLTFLLLGIYTPFGMDDLSILWRWGFAFGIGSLASLAILGTVSLLYKFTSKEYLDENWTFGKEIVLMLSVLSVITVLIFLSFVNLDLSNQPPLEIFQDTVLKTILASIIPIIVLVLTEQYFEQRKQLHNIQSLNKKISDSGAVQRQTPDTENLHPYIILENENGKPVLKIQSKELIFFQSEGNYLEVYHTSTLGEIRKTLIRNTLKAYLERLPESDFFHAHKKFLVNRHKIQELRGNSRNYEIRLENYPDWIPVSRAKSSQLMVLFKA